jgi:OmpA-OmpF porin, OOP family
MKKILFSFLVLGLCISSFGQDDQKKGPAIGVHFFFDDFNSAAAIRSGGIGSVLKSKMWHKTNSMISGLALSYIQGLSNKVDLQAPSRLLSLTTRSRANLLSTPIIPFWKELPRLI